MVVKLKSTKLIFLYRSFLFRFIKFETDDKNLEKIVKALNIKQRRDRIVYVFDEAIDEITKYYSEDLCQFKDGQCIVQRKNKLDRVNGCCRLCPNVTDKGCPSVNIACKLIYCKTAIGNVKLLKLSDIKILKCLSLIQRMIIRSNFFSLREEVINDLYYGIIYALFRGLFKEIKHAFYRRKYRNVL